MTKERFAEILREYGFSEHQIDLLWGTRPKDNLNELALRLTARYIAPFKDDLVQR